MADRTVTVTISAQDNFSAVVDKYTAAMDEAEASTVAAGEATAEAAGSFDLMGAAMQGFMAVMAVQQIANFAGQMVQLGQSVTYNEAIFGQLTQSIGGSATVMDSLRQSTRGAVDDLDLMAASSHLLRTGLMDNSQELAGFLGNLEKLKDPTQSLNDAVTTLSQSLQTQTTRALNQFGLNVDAVKARYEELKAAGMDAATAFKQAVEEAMTGAVQKLGDATMTATTNVDILIAHFNNLKDAAAQGISGVVNQAAGFVNITIALVGAVSDKASRDAANAAQQERIVNLLKQYQAAHGTTGPDGTNIQTPQDMINFQLGVGNDPGGGTGISSGDYAAMASQIQSWANTASGAWKQVTQALSAYHDQMAIVQKQTADASAAMLTQTDIQERINATGSLYGTMQHQTMGLPYSQATGVSVMSNTDVNMPAFLDPARAEQIKGEYQNILQIISDAQDNYGKLITPEDKTNMDAISASAKTLADEAQKAEDAFNNMSLSQMLGQGGGGALGQLTDMIVAQDKQKGMSSKDLQQLQNTFDLASGRQTDLSLALPSFLKSLSSMTPQGQLQASQNLLASLQEARGLQLPQSAFTPANLNYFAGLAGTNGKGGDLTFLPNFNPQQAMQQYLAGYNQMGKGGTFGVSQPGDGSIDFTHSADWYASFYNAGPPGANVPHTDQFGRTIYGNGGKTDTAGTDTTLNTVALASNTIKDNLSQANDALKGAGDAIQKSFQSASDILKNIGARSIPIKFDVIGIPDWILKAMGGGSFQGVQTVVTNNAGVVPGTRTPGRGAPVIDR